MQVLLPCLRKLWLHSAPLLPGDHQKGSGVCAPLLRLVPAGMHPPDDGESRSLCTAVAGPYGAALTCIFPCGAATGRFLPNSGGSRRCGCQAAHLPPQWEVALLSHLPPPQLLECLQLLPHMLPVQNLPITNSRSSLKLRCIESVMPSSHLILCRPLLLLPPIPPSIRVFSSESTPHMRWPKYATP